MAVNNPEWRYAWPEEPEATLLFKYFAHFYAKSIEAELENMPIGEEDKWATPELDRRVRLMIEKARSKAAWKKRAVAARNVAAVIVGIVLVLITVPSTVLFAVSPEFRETLYRYVIDWRQGHTDIGFDVAFPDNQTFPKYYVPSFIPEGFTLKDYVDDGVVIELYYTNEGQYFYFTTSDITTDRTADNETATFHFDYNINGLPVIIVENQGIVLMYWHDDVTAFRLQTNLPLGVALNIASSYKLQEKI
jgi:hypothetical protein